MPNLTQLARDRDSSTTAGQDRDSSTTGPYRPHTSLVFMLWGPSPPLDTMLKTLVVFFTYEINSERKNKTQNLNSANIIEQMAVGHIRRTMSTLHSQVGSHSVMGTPGSPLLRG